MFICLQDFSNGGLDQDRIGNNFGHMSNPGISLAQQQMSEQLPCQSPPQRYPYSHFDATPGFNSNGMKS